MLLTEKTVDEVEYVTKKVKLKKANAEVIIALVPGSVMVEARALADKKDDPDAMRNFGFKILSSSIVDEKGEPAFTTIESFEKLAPAVQDEITAAVYDYNGIGEGSSENIAKN